MDNEFKIYVDRLKDGKIEKIDFAVLPDFLEVEEQELSFSGKVLVQGEVYAVEEELVFHLDIGAQVRIPCTICNDLVEVAIQVKGLYYIEPLKNIKGRVFDMSNLVRESVVLEIPPFAECCEGNCPKRVELKKYLKSASSDEPDPDAEGYHPFSDLTLKE